MSPQTRCPTCSKPFDPELSRSMPFCSDRCRRIDLNRWLNEEISIPVNDEREPDSDEPDDRAND